MATRVLNGRLREVWQEAVPLDGGGTQIINTGIALRSLADLARIWGLMIPTVTVGRPLIAAVSSLVNGLLRVTITNTAVAGQLVNGYTLDVQLIHSIDQANDTTAGGRIYFVVPAGMLHGDTHSETGGDPVRLHSCTLATRPVLGVGDRGAVVWVTDGGMHGLAITWSGTAWVDGTGAVVA